MVEILRVSNLPVREHELKRVLHYKASLSNSAKDPFSCFSSCSDLDFRDIYDDIWHMGLNLNSCSLS